MARPRARDWLLLAALLTPWAACTALHVKQIAAGQLAWIGVYVDAPAGAAHPVVRGFWPGASPSASGSLAPGDRLLRVGERALRGVGPFGFAARVYAEAAQRRATRVSLAYERAGVERTTTIWLVPVAFPWRMLPLTVTLVLTAALVLARRPRERIARAFFLFAVAYGLHWTFFFGGPPAQTYAWVAVFLAASTLMLPLILRAALLFPTEVAPPAGRLPRWPWLFAVFGPISASWLYGVPLAPEVGLRAVFLINAAFILVLLAVLTRNYLRAAPLGRRQLKWIVLGVYAGTAPVLAADLVAALRPALWWLHDVAVIAEILIPASILLAIVRTHPLDVDRLITGAAVYSVLSVLVVAALLSVVPQIARAASAATEVDPSTVQLLLSVLVAVCLVPGQRLLRPHAERLLFRERHALRSGVDELLRALGGADRPETLLTLAGERLDALLRPAACAIYAPLRDGFAPVFARHGDAQDPPRPLPAGSAPAAALGGRSAPLDVPRWLRAHRRSLASEDRAAFESLGAVVLLPLRRGEALAGFIALGAKRSGDIYTDTDLALLGAVADKLSSELLRFDAAEILRQERRMSDALRRYVPEPVAARLSRGQTLDGGEREVSVLFVDIRGYTAYSEAQAAEAVFSMVNRYTESVSAVIQRRGGTVVEFLGDGVMAVFGAPDPIADHARVAVEAAREVVETVRDLALRGADGVSPIAVGIGVASGRAFVGNVRTSDRLVYTAVGDVVNLASRIQGLTRELRAAVAIDAATHRTAGASAAGFAPHPRMRVRGRAEPVDVYALPAAA